MWESTESDIVVVGSGIAGLTFSLLAARRCRVALVTKSELGTGNSLWAQGGIAASMGSDDRPLLHGEDTLNAGIGLGDPLAVETLVNEGAGAVRFLEDLGVAFDKDEKGGMALGREGAHSRNRIVHSGGDATGINIIETLLFHVKRNPGITMIQHTDVIDLLVKDGRCRGVVALAGGNRPTIIYGGAAILSSGGLGHLYPHTTNTEGANGEGYAMAWRAGARMRDMEFVQFHPTALKVDRNPMPLISEAVRGEGAKLLNSRSERFMENVHPQKELAPRDIVSRAIFSEMERGNRAFLDATKIGHFAERFPTIYSSCKREGINPCHDLIPVAPAAHYEMGGIETDLYGATSVPGLFALGEVGSTGVHGANRLASNSLLEALVFAKKAAEAIPRDAATADADCPLPEYSSTKFAQSNTPPDHTLIMELQSIMWERAGIIRNEWGLKSAIDWIDGRIDECNARDEGVPSRKLNLLTTARLVVEGALWRRESRGGHFRSDFPKTLAHFCAHSIQVVSDESGCAGSTAKAGSC